jgi:hypothetical protein
MYLLAVCLTYLSVTQTIASNDAVMGQQRIGKGVGVSVVTLFTVKIQQSSWSN